MPARRTLIHELAVLLDRVSDEAGRAFTANREEIIRAVDRLAAEDPRLNTPQGAEVLELTFGATGKHAAFWSSVLELRLAELAVNTMTWICRAGRERGIAGELLQAQVRLWAGAVEEVLPAPWAAPIGAVMHWVAGRQALRPGRSAAAAPAAAAGAWQALMPAFLDLLVEGRKLEALHLAEARVRTHGDLRDFHCQVIAPALYEVGRLWEEGGITVAQEHRASAIARLVMDTLFPLLVPFRLRKGRVLVSCANNEFHELGGRMLADLLWGEGWEVEFLGAGRSEPDLLAAVRQGRPHVLGLSLAMPFNLDEVRRLIARVRREPAFSSGRVLVGGNLIRHSPGVAPALGADGHALDALDAIRILDEWWGQLAPQ